MHASIRILGCFLLIAGRSADGCGDVRVPWCGLERTVEDSHPAVSYTHLDVYKRQSMASILGIALGVTVLITTLSLIHI